MKHIIHLFAWQCICYGAINNQNGRFNRNGPFSWMSSIFVIVMCLWNECWSNGCHLHKTDQQVRYSNVPLKWQTRQKWTDIHLMTGFERYKSQWLYLRYVFFNAHENKMGKPIFNAKKNQLLIWWIPWNCHAKCQTDSFFYLFAISFFPFQWYNFNTIYYRWNKFLSLFAISLTVRFTGQHIQHTAIEFWWSYLNGNFSSISLKFIQCMVIRYRTD